MSPEGGDLSMDDVHGSELAVRPRKVPAGEFKQTCLQLLEEVRRTGRPLLVTKRGIPVALVGPVPRDAVGRDWRGAMRGRGRVLGDLVAPAVPAEEWSALER